MARKRRRLIPFWLVNKVLGYEGNERKKAEAKYYYTGETLEEKLIEVDSSNDQEKEIKKLELSNRKGEISKLEYEKQLATLKEEPWVYATLQPDPDNPLNGFFDIDWNKFFIAQLEKKGYKGSNDEEFIEQWLRAIHTNQAYGHGDLQIGDVDNLERRKELDDGRAEYR